MIGTLFNIPNSFVKGPTFTVRPVLFVIKTFLPTTIEAACESSSVLHSLLLSSMDIPPIVSHSSLLLRRFAIAFKVVALSGLDFVAVYFSFIPFTTAITNFSNSFSLSSDAFSSSFMSRIVKYEVGNDIPSFGQWMRVDRRKGKIKYEREED